MDFTDANTLETALVALFPTWDIIENSSTFISVGPTVPVLWSSTNPTILGSVSAYWSTTVDGFGGWLDYTIVDAARKAMVKEESDPSALMAELAELKLRIEQAAENRDAGFPATVSDATRSGNSGGWGWGDLGEHF